MKYENKLEEKNKNKNKSKKFKLVIIIMKLFWPDVDAVKLDDGVSRTQSCFLSGASRHHGLYPDRILSTENETETTVLAPRYRYQSAAK